MMELEHEHHHALSIVEQEKAGALLSPNSPYNTKSLKFASSLSPIHHQLAFLFHPSTPNLVYVQNLSPQPMKTSDPRKSDAKQLF